MRYTAGKQQTPIQGGTLQESSGLPLKEVHCRKAADSHSRRYTAGKQRTPTQGGTLQGKQQTPTQGGTLQESSRLPLKEVYYKKTADSHSRRYTTRKQRTHIQGGALQENMYVRINKYTRNPSHCIHVPVSDRIESTNKGANSERIPIQPHITSDPKNALLTSSAFRMATEHYNDPQIFPHMCSVCLLVLASDVHLEPGFEKRPKQIFTL